jgi:hypothetical protein
MNGKKAKMIRRAAERATKGKPYADYQRNRRGMIELVPDCTKRIHKLAKRMYYANN